MSDELDDWEIAYKSGLEQGAGAERARIVEWLRIRSKACQYAADMIERGAHVSDAMP